jgi:FAD/FMN-containing dehydrogenase
MVAAAMATAVAVSLAGKLAKSTGDARHMEWLSAMLAVAAAMWLVAEISGLVFDKWLFGGRRYNHAPKQDPTTGRSTYTNWGGNQTFVARQTEGPHTLDELLASVEKHGRAGRKIKAIGSLHSWSACAVAEDVCVPMQGLHRVLSHDPVRRTITAEAGIQLRALYAAMDERELAIASMPNVDTILLGGAIANATHGTNFSRGTMSSYVCSLQMVLFHAPEGAPDEGRAEFVTLLRDDPDAEKRAWFEAAVVSFGSLGIVYAVELQCEAPFACFVAEHSFPFSQIDGRIAELAAKHFSSFLSVGTSNGVCRSRVQVPVPCDLVQADATCLLTDWDLRVVKILLWAATPSATTWLWLRGYLGRIFYKASMGGLGSVTASQRRKREGVMSWRDAELLSRLFAVTATSPWINLEYAVPVERADEAARELLKLHQSYPVFTNFVMRPVGADSVGFLSPTKGRPTVYFDIGYHPQLIDTGLYEQVEALLLSCEGRCSWSRLFKAPVREVVKQYPQYQEFLRAARQMDPCGVFANAFSAGILSAQQPAPERSE